MRQPKSRTILLILSILILSLTIGIFAFRVDGDVMWHFKTGEKILLNGSVFKNDIFSWQSGLKWMCHEWLYDIILFLFYSTGGLMAMKLFLITAIALPLFISFFYNRNKIKNPILYIIFIIVLIYGWNSSYCARPSEFSIALMLIAAIIIIENHKYQYQIFFVLVILCANIHGGSICQLLIIPVLCMMAALLEKIVHKKKKYKELRKYLYLLLFGCIGALINPYGIHIFRYTTEIFIGAKFINSHIIEWMPTQITVITAVILLGISLALGANTKFRTMEQKTIQKYILIFAFLCQGLAIRRMLFNATCLIMVFSYEYFESYMIGLFQSLQLPKIKESICNRIVLLGISIGTVCFLFVGFYFISSDRDKSYIETVNENCNEFKEVSDYMKSHNITGNIYNNYNQGGLFILHDLKTFVDPRCDPFMESFSNSTSLTDYFTTMDAEDTTQYNAWVKLNEIYAFDYAVFHLKNSADREIVNILELKDYHILLKNSDYAIIEIKGHS